MKKVIVYFTAILFAGLSFSCDEDDESINPVGNIAGELALMRATSMIFFANEADFSTGYELASDNSSLRMSSEAAICGNISIQNASGYPKIFTVDYGNGCTDDNGITRSGTLKVTLTGPLLWNGNEMIVERINYYINGYKIEGTVTHTNNSTTLFNPQWLITMPNGQITTPEGEVYTHSGNRTMRQIGGFDTEVLLDNTFEITAGSHTVTDMENSTLNANVTAPLQKDYNCSYIAEGTINLQGNWLDGDLDFGNGSCDDDAIYTHDPTGQIYPVEL